jgi:glutathione S-transferase
MQLFIHPASPNCIAVLAVADRLGLSIEIQHVDLFNDEQKTSEYMALNPNGLVPVLRDGDFVLWETVAILEYLSSSSGTSQLLPEEARSRANVVRWLAWDFAHWKPSLKPFIFERMFKPMKGLGAPDEEMLSTVLPRLKVAAGILDRQLEHGTFVCGEEPTVADFYLASYPMYAEPAGIDFAAFPHLQAWLRTVHALPEWQRAAHPHPQ